MFYRQEQASGNTAEPIAIVGVGCKLPGNISTVEELFSALRDGRDCITEVPPERWDTDAFYDPDPVAPGKTYVRYGGFITDIDQFDAGFFGISDAEAARMDPQQRIVLQTVWHALENAGQSADELVQSNTGVFLAMMNTNNYSQLKARYEGASGIMGYDAMSDAMSITAGRISHFLGLEGPCIALDTACSSSMVALHLARQSILAGDCDSAIVVGVNAILHPGIHIAFSKLGLMSRQGRCAAFDMSADGYVRGEGCVAAVIRRESLAMARGDRIFASIVGTAVNQDGRTPALTAPNGLAQEKVIRTALARMGISPNEIEYVEAHGTGTPVGDPIEMSAIVNVYGPGRTDKEALFVGSVKSNFGHIEAGAGLLGVVKTALSLKYELILPSLHFTQLNPNIDLGQAPIRVATTTIPWPRNKHRRMAGVNSFGYSGTNAHAILQEAPLAKNGNTPGTYQESLPARPCELVVLSAKSADTLDKLIHKWTYFLLRNDTIPLRDIAFTAATGRAHLTHRLAVVGRGRHDISEKLQMWREGRTPQGLAAGKSAVRRKPKIAFMFTGQGAQYPNMGRQLYESEPRFKEAIDQCASLMDEELDISLHEILFGPSSTEYLDNTCYVQPALFAIEYALADQLRLWGIQPDYVVGHSVGEIVAACVAGVLSLEDAVRFVVARGRLMGQLPRGGKMLAVGAPLGEVEKWIQGMEADVSIASVNGPLAVVVSGKADAVDIVAIEALATGRKTKELDVSHPFHSPLMDPILKELTSVASSMHIRPAKIPIVSNVTGDFMDYDISGDYWSSHVRQTVLFYQGMSKIVDAGCSILVEIGPHPALTSMVASAFDMSKTRVVPTLIRDKADVSNIFQMLGAVFANGVSPNLDQLFWSPAYRRVSLPSYPFRRNQHWLAVVDLMDNLPDEPLEIQLGELHPILGRAMSVTSRRAVFETTLSTTRPWTDHRVLGSTVFPGAGYLEMAARGYAAVSNQDWCSVRLRDVAFERPLILMYGKQKKVTLTLNTATSNGTGTATFIIASTGDESREIYCRGRIEAANERVEQISLETELGCKDSEMAIGPFYGELRKAGLEYGAKFAIVRELWLGKSGSGEAIGRVATGLSGNEVNEDPFSNVVLLDGSLHIFGAALRTLDGIDYLGAFVPAAIQTVTLQRELPAQIWGHVTIRTNSNGRAAIAHIRILNNEGEILADIDGLELRQKTSLTSPEISETAAVNRDSFSSESRGELIKQLRELPPVERVGVLAKWLMNEIKDTLGQAAEGLALDEIDPTMAFLEIGLDSLLVTELQRRIQEKLDFRFQPMQGLDYQTIESLAEYILDQVLFSETVSATEMND